MAGKRSLDALDISDDNESIAPPTSKRQRNRASTKSQQPVTDLTYGQKCVFPGLDGIAAGDDDDLEYEDQGSAMAYLQSVR